MIERVLRTPGGARGPHNWLLLVPSLPPTPCETWAKPHLLLGLSFLSVPEPGAASLRSLAAVTSLVSFQAEPEVGGENPQPQQESPVPGKI